MMINVPCGMRNAISCLARNNVISILLCKMSHHLFFSMSTKAILSVWIVLCSLSPVAFVFHFSRQSRCSLDVSTLYTFGLRFHHIINPVINFDFLSVALTTKSRQKEKKRILFYFADKWDKIQCSMTQDFMGIVKEDNRRGIKLPTNRIILWPIIMWKLNNSHNNSRIRNSNKYFGF